MLKKLLGSVALFLMACAPSYALQCSNCPVVEAHTFPGANAGQKIANAIAAFPAGVGGYVDATGFPHPQDLIGFTIPPGVTVKLSPIFYTLACGSPITVNQGGHFEGGGANSPGATTIKLFNGCNHDVIRAVSTGGESNWWHHGSISNIRLLCNKQNNTDGNCLSVYGLAETSVIEKLSINDAPEVGLYIKGSQSGTGSIRNVTVNTSTTYGVQLDEFRSGIKLDSVGGDQNPVTFAITSPMTGGGAILIEDGKSEGTVANDPNPAILISGGSAPVALTLVGGNFLTPNADRTLIRLEGSVDHKINIMGPVSGNSFTRLIDDQKNGVTVPTAAVTYHQMFFYTGGKYMRFDENGLFATHLTVPGFEGGDTSALQTQIDDINVKLNGVCQALGGCAP